MFLYGIQICKVVDLAQYADDAMSIKPTPFSYANVPLGTQYITPNP
jgi:hypothetical protein